MGNAFPDTHWTLLLKKEGGDKESTVIVNRRFDSLCTGYWYPLYAYVRRTGYDLHDAEELTQEFLTQLIEKDYLKDVNRQRGKFRSFLLVAMKHFLSKQRERARAKKRGGGRVPISLDFRDAESKYKLEPADELTPERLYERRWALTLLDQVIGHLEREFVDAGKLATFEHLKGFLTGGRDSPPYRQVAEELAMTEGAVKVAVHRLRRRYRELLKEEIAQTVVEPEEIEDELRALFAAVRSN